MKMLNNGNRNIFIAIALTAPLFMLCLTIFALDAVGDPPMPGCDFSIINDECTVTPTIDNATIDTTDDAEWSVAQVRDLIPDPPPFDGPQGKVRIMRSDDALYFLITVDDNNRTEEDQIEIHFDTLHHHASNKTVVFTFNRMDGGHTRSINTDGTITSDDWPPDTEGVLQIKDLWENELNVPICSECAILDGYDEGWSIEVRISASDLDGMPSLPQIMGVAVKVDNEGGGFDTVSMWPTHFADADPGPWANLKTDVPIHYALVLDHSGSMNTQEPGAPGTRWERATRAVDLFVATLGLLKRNYFNDQVSISKYAWDCFNDDPDGNQTGPIDASDHSHEPVPIPDAPGETGDGNVTFTENLGATPPDWNNCTPIKSGVDYAINEQLDYPPPVTDLENRIVLLLSDGLHNRPHGEVPFVPGDYPDDIKSFTRIRTIAMGEDITSGTQLLQDIATAFNGGGTLPRYNLADSFDDLLAAYIQTLSPLLGTDDIDVFGYTFPVDPAEKLVVIGVWSDPLQATPLTIEPVAGGSSITGEKYNTTIGYAAAEVEDPVVGDWQWTVGPGAVEPDKVFVLIDLRIRARFMVEQKSYGAGESILLQVKLTDRGEPIRNRKNSVKVSVEVARPGEGLGNFLATIQEDCSLGRSDGMRSSRHRFDPGSNAFALPTAGRTNLTQPGDPATGRYALAAYHLDRCGDDYFDPADPRLHVLHDDGTHGDPKADDGIYSLAFKDTDKEGTYKFRFHVLGAAADGMRFSRTRTVSQFLRIKPVPRKSEIHFQAGDPQGKLQTGNVSIVPRDRLGNYLGPGFHHRMKFKTTAGKFIQPLVDHGDGSYSQLLGYDKERDRPKISMELGGQQIGRLKVVKDLDLVLPFVGWFNFDGELDLKDGPVVGARLGYLYTDRLTVELEGGNTFTETNAGDTGNVLQVMANVRYGLKPRPTVWGELVPFATAGAGYLFFNGFDDDDEAFAIQAGVGATLELSDTFGVRFDGRIFRVGEVMGKEASVNYQVTAGLVFKF